mmetsp:Transcript_24743/g.36615  ORF Transcript_24743/g.36615 Transcript_24743/m.36615 type:complete len:93 (-) Transcript_24743:43-321(-)
MRCEFIPSHNNIKSTRKERICPNVLLKWRVIPTALDKNIDSLHGNYLPVDRNWKFFPHNASRLDVCCLLVRPLLGSLFTPIYANNSNISLPA